MSNEYRVWPEPIQGFHTPVFLLSTFTVLTQTETCVEDWLATESVTASAPNIFSPWAAILSMVILSM